MQRHTKSLLSFFLSINCIQRTADSSATVGGSRLLSEKAKAPALSQVLFGDPSEIRTPDTLIKSHSEKRSHIFARRHELLYINVFRRILVRIFSYLAITFHENKLQINTKQPPRRIYFKAKYHQRSLLKIFSQFGGKPIFCSSMD